MNLRYGNAFIAATRLIALVLVGLGVVFLCLAGPVRFLALRPEFYRWGQSRHVTVATPSPAAQAAADVALARYFAGPANSLPTQLRGTGLSEEFFTERERIHLEDVHWLLQGVGLVAAIGAALVAIGIVLAIAGAAGLNIVAVAIAVRRGAIAAGAIIVLFGAASLFDFQALFLQFHLLSFSNDLWQLDPAIHNLIRIFPFAFFLEAAIVDALLSLALAMGAWVGTTWLIHRQKHAREAQNAVVRR